MDIANALINLRDDLKEWSTNNMLVLRSLIPTKTSQLTNDNGYLTSVPSDYATKEYVQSEIAKIDNSVDIVSSVDEMTDTTKQYVYSGTNTWWRYRSVTIPAGGVLPNIDNAIKWSTTEVVLNKRLNSSATEVDAPGCALFYFTFNDEMKDILNTIDPVWIRMKGCSVYATSGNQTSTKVNGWNSTGGSIMGCSPFSQILMYEETKNGISNNPYSSATFPYSDNKVAPVTAIKFGYYNKTVSDNSTNEPTSYLASMVNGKFALSLIVNFANTNPITESYLENVYITFNEPIVSYEEQTISEWYDTGIEYNPNDDSSIVELKTRVNDVELKTNDLETRVIKLEKDTPSNNGGNETTTSTLPSYWKNRLDEISPKIDALQKEYGVDAFQFLWASDIHSVPGSSPNDTSNMGNICRYMMDKHNIPFLALSGDIMSQASHSNVETVWNEYDKLNTMFSPVRNDEFLATKGNHDGAWGSPVDGVYYLNNIGTKELFNAFYRRQTLDRNRVFGKDGTYFYVDCPNVRFYMLNTHTDGDGSENSDGSAVYNPMKHFVLGNDQLNWIADSLLTVQEGQKVIFMGHAPIKACIDGSIFTGILTSYKNRNSYEGTTNITGTYWGTDEKYSKVSVNKDFANAKGDLVGYFHGHIHKDTMTVDGEYPIISITTGGGDLRDDYLVNGTLTRVKGTATETAIDLVTVTGDYVYLTRIGSGYDRKYNRLTKEITIDYDSAYVPPAEEPDSLPNGVINLMDTGEIYLNQRYSHSGGGIASDGTGMFALIVPFETNGSTTHTLKFRNLSIPLNSASGSTLYGLDSNKGNSQMINEGVIPTMTGLTILDNGKSAEIKFTAPSSVKYLALTIRVNNESTITESDIADYIITLDEDGVTIPPTEDQLTQGEITSEVTWKENTRLSSSSGNYSTQASIASSSDIAVKKGDVIRVYGFPKVSEYSYVGCYKDETFVFSITEITADGQTYTKSNITYTTDITANGVVSITINNENIDTVRICNYCTDTSILRVSRNAELIIEESELTQGEITSEVTWIADKRLSSSSGGYSDLTGCYASSDIPCKNGDVIRIYGASEWRYYAYIAGYTSNNAFTGVITMETSSTGANNYIEVIKSTDNTLTITVIHDSISYIRVCNNGGLVPSNIRISRNVELL